MSTPFDNKTWTILNTGTIFDFHPPEIETDGEKDLQAVHADPGTMHTPPQAEYHPPLRSHTHLVITICDKGTVDIDFKNAPEYMQEIWKDARNVYYDPEFFSIRGDLMYNKVTGLSSMSFGQHFVIAYKGKMATGGVSSQLKIDLTDEEDIPMPTDDINIAFAKRGGWRADEVAKE